LTSAVRDVGRLKPEEQDPEYPAQNGKDTTNIRGVRSSPSVHGVCLLLRELTNYLERDYHRHCPVVMSQCPKQAGENITIQTGYRQGGYWQEKRARTVATPMNRVHQRAEFHSVDQKRWSNP
jgi:hypothetical protein